MTQQIAIVNESTVITDEQLGPIVAALQIQVTRDFAPAYGVSATLEFFYKPNPLPPDAWVIAVLDDSDQAGALGYHDLTKTGQPLGKVFAKTDVKYGDSVSVTLSHELLEMLGDPFINLCIQADDNLIYAYEVGDPVEADALGYQINGVQVSDFVLPAYFEASSEKAAQTDFTNHLNGRRAPALTPDGYISKLDPKSGWTQINGQLTRASLERAAIPVGSRRWRRSVPVYERRRSTR